MQAGLQMAGSFALCIGRSPFSEMEPRSGGIELKARQNGRGKPSAHKAEGPAMQADLQMTVSFALCIGRSPFSEMELRSGGIEQKHVRSDGGNPVRKLPLEKTKDMC